MHLLPWISYSKRKSFELSSLNFERPLLRYQPETPINHRLAIHDVPSKHVAALQLVCLGELAFY
jgi:hypothetical protein